MDEMTLEARTYGFARYFDVCPTNALRLGQKLCTKTPIDEVITKMTPRDTKWKEDKWNREESDCTGGLCLWAAS